MVLTASLSSDLDPEGRGYPRPLLQRESWYRRVVTMPERRTDEHWLLHFGAVDWHATVWVDGVYAGEHAGGYTPFTLDVTEFLSGQVCEIVVRADDDPHDLASPAGSRIGSSNHIQSGIRAPPASGRRSGSKRCRRRASDVSR